SSLKNVILFFVPLRALRGKYSAGKAADIITVLQEFVKPLDLPLLKLNMFCHMRKHKLLSLFCFIATAAHSQETYPVNGVQDYRQGYLAFTHATIVKDSKTTLTEATLIIKEGKIIAV